ncbi:MAG: hypothetical protein LBV00_07725 [Propionibacteriaceae bacterium]|nr:hypothetical protein [Propionibacteriaceae bacterium]
MPVTVGACGAKIRFSNVVDRASRGRAIMASRHGVPVAQFGPVSGPSAQQAAQAVEAIKHLRARINLRGLSLIELKDEGRP